MSLVEKAKEMGIKNPHLMKEETLKKKIEEAGSEPEFIEVDLSETEKYQSKGYEVIEIIPNGNSVTHKLKRVS